MQASRSRTFFRMLLIVLIKYFLIVATVNITLAFEEEKHCCQIDCNVCTSLKVLSMCDEVLFDGPFTDLKALLQLGQVLLGHPSAALYPLFLQSSKNHLISSVQCGCSLKWVTRATCILLYSFALQGTITPKTNFSFSSWSLSWDWMETVPHFPTENFPFCFLDIHGFSFTLKRNRKKKCRSKMCRKHSVHQRLAQSFGS